MTTFTHLHVHSHYSLLDGLSKVEEIVDKCIATGIKSSSEKQQTTYSSRKLQALIATKGEDVLR